MFDFTKREFLAKLSLVSTSLLVENAFGQSQPTLAQPNPQTLRKVSLEDHFIFPEFIEYLGETKQNLNTEHFDDVIAILSDFGDRRLQTMDQNGIDRVVLSLAGPGVQAERDTGTAKRLARLANDSLANEVQKRPNRYSGFAHLAMQDPGAAADELERCVRTLGFKGALINGHTLGVYLDDRRYDVFWERASTLQAPIYIHPTNAPERPKAYDDHPEMWGAVWSWTNETCFHALRLVFAGVFDRYPNARVILGHMGETIPYLLWRFDSRYPNTRKVYTLKKKPSEYMRENLRITTSGVCFDAALRCCLDAMGPENVMFSTDYPNESAKIASDWLSRAALTDIERENVAHRNAEALLRS